MHRILFYSQKREHGYMSNFYELSELKLPLNLDFATHDDPQKMPESRYLFNFETSEHAYQMNKFWPPADEKNRIPYYEFMMLVARVTGARDAAALGRLKVVGETQIPKFRGLPEELQKKVEGKTVSQIVRMYREHVKMRPDWEAVKDQCMRVVVMQKFLQNPGLAAKLLDTGHAELIEHTVNDSYWGDGGQPSKGKNMLGTILMETREKLRQN